MDTKNLGELAVHYAVMIILSLVALFVVQTSFGRQNLLIELGIVMIVFLGYGAVVMRLGIAPEVWTRE